MSHAHEQPVEVTLVEKPFAMLAEFDGVAEVKAAAAKVRDAGYRDWDVHAPFPIHGIEKAMGMKPTILPWITLLGGLAGCLGGLGMLWYINASTLEGIPAHLQGYQYITAGKPIFSLPANIPIIFETTVLLASFGTLIGMLALNRLPMLYNPLLKSRRFRRVTDDKFFVVIDASDPKFDESATRNFLASLGSTHIEIVTDVT